MNVLEKILEEIEERIKRLKEADNMCRVNAERNRNFESMKYFQSLMFATERAESIIGDIIRPHMDEAKDINVPSNDGWISVDERLPEDDRHILLSFENFSLPLVGRYEENEKGGAFYLGDCDEEDTCISNDLYVNAWTYLPERYRGDSNA